MTVPVCAAADTTHAAAAADTDTARKIPHIGLLLSVYRVEGGEGRSVYMV